MGHAVDRIMSGRTYLDWNATAPLRPEAGLLGLRQALGTFANLRPVRVHPALSEASTLKAEVVAGVDLVFVRELTEGLLYSETVVAGAPEFRPNDEITVAMRVITRRGANRVAREALSPT